MKFLFLIKLAFVMLANGTKSHNPVKKDIEKMQSFKQEAFQTPIQTIRERSTSETNPGSQENPISIQRETEGNETVDGIGSFLPYISMGLPLSLSAGINIGSRLSFSTGRNRLPDLNIRSDMVAITEGIFEDTEIVERNQGVLSGIGTIREITGSNIVTRVTRNMRSRENYMLTLKMLRKISKNNYFLI